MRRMLLLFLLIGGVALTQVSAYAEKPLTPVKLQLHWVPNVEFAGILLAKERGWYEEAGIDLEIVKWSSKISTVKSILKGRAQISMTEGDVLIKYRAKGAPIKAIGVQFQRSPSCLISKKELGITHPKDLVGKRIGVTSHRQLLVKTMLASQNLTFDDIVPVDKNASVQRLLNDEYDVLVGYMPSEPLLLKQLGCEVNVIPGYMYGYDFYAGVYIVHDDMIKEQPEILENFLRATYRGWKEAFNDPKSTAELIIEKYYPEGLLAQQIQELELYRFLATLGVGENFLGMMNELQWKNGVNSLLQFGMIEENVSVNDLFTMEFLKKMYSEK